MLDDQGSPGKTILARRPFAITAPTVHAPSGQLQSGRQSRAARVQAAFNILETFAVRVYHLSHFPLGDLMNPRLVALAGPLKGATVSLGLGTTNIGRDISSNVAVSDSRVSKHHASIVLDEKGECRISDLDSANGTLVNGVPVREASLKEGDVIQVGISLFLFALPPAEIS